MTFQELVENFVGIPEITTIVDKLKKKLREEIREENDNTRREIEVKLTKFKEDLTNETLTRREMEAKLTKFKEDLTNETLTVIKSNLNKLAEDVDMEVKCTINSFREEMRGKQKDFTKTVREMVQKTVDTTKQEMMDLIEEGTFSFNRKRRRSDLEETTDNNETPAKARREAEPMAEDVQIIDHTPGISKSLRQSLTHTPKINWRKDHPEAEKFILARHEELNFRKNNTVKTTIFQEGVDKGLWQDTKEWKAKVDNKINTNYKANCVLSDTKSLP